ncbi:leucine-rich repeat domain-containing protein [Lachnospiraceae bacterium 46-15]
MRHFKQVTCCLSVLCTTVFLMFPIQGEAKFKSPDKSEQGIEYYIRQSSGKKTKVSAKLKSSARVIRVPESVMIGNKSYTITEISGNCYPDTLDASPSTDAYKCRKNTKTVRVIIPKTVRQIEQGAFTNFTNLKEIVVDKQSTYFQSKKGSLLSKDGRILYAVPSMKGTYRVPKGVQVIYNRAFAYSKVKKVILPKSCKAIQERAFYRCKNLKEVQNLRYIEKFGKDIFYGSQIQ